MLVDEYMALTEQAREEHLEGLDEVALLQLGIDLYHAAHYWHAHEAWEQVWLDAPQELRAFYQGLIQITAAFVHVSRGEYPGSVRLLEAGIDKLQGYESPTLGVDVAALLDGARAALARLVELGERRVRQFDLSLVPKVRYV